MSLCLTTHKKQENNLNRTRTAASDKSKVSARAGLQIFILFRGYCLVIHQGSSKDSFLWSMVPWMNQWALSTRRQNVLYSSPVVLTKLMLYCCQIGSETLFAVVIACYSEIHSTPPTTYTRRWSLVETGGFPFLKSSCGFFHRHKYFSIHITLH